MKVIACGHVHEARGTGFLDLNDPLVLNAGALGRPYPWLGWGLLTVGGGVTDGSLVFVT